jgi:hypothetical protein
MKRRDTKWRGLKPLQRLGIGFIGLVISGTGIATLLQGRLHFQDYRGLVVFAPFSLVVGALVIVMAIRLGKRE